MFLPRVFLFFLGELLQSPDDAESCVAGLYDVVDVAITCGVVRIAEEFLVFLLLLRDLFLFLLFVAHEFQVLGV